MENTLITEFVVKHNKFIAEYVVGNNTLIALLILGFVALAVIVHCNIRSVETPDITEPKE